MQAIYYTNFKNIPYVCDPMCLLDRKRLASPGMCVFWQYEWLMTFVTLQTQ